MLEWEHRERSIEAKTDYGTYTIRQSVTANAVEVQLESNDPSMSFIGRHNTIAAAKAAAKADEEYRQLIWETL